MPPKRKRTEDDREAERTRRAESRAADPAAAAAFQASQAREANRVSQAQSRSRLQADAAAASPDPAAAAAELHASQARDAHRISQAASRARNAPPVDPVATGAELDALLDMDAFTVADLDLIDSTYERNVSAALAFFSANTQVAFGMRRDVSMDAQLWDVLGDPTDPNSAANGVTAETKAACIERCMKTLAQRELRACVACGVRRRPF